VIGGFSFIYNGYSRFYMKVFFHACKLFFSLVSNFFRENANENANEAGMKKPRFFPGLYLLFFEIVRRLIDFCL